MEKRVIKFVRPSEKSPLPGPVAQQPVSPLLSGAIVSTLMRLSLPNTVAVGAAVMVSIAETSYVGLLGISSLAGMAVVFPIVMLQYSLSNGAMGGGVSSAISRALGAGDEDRAQALALHGLIVGFLMGLAFMTIMLILGPAIYRMLGARGAAHEQALLYSNVLFSGAIGIWLTNTLVSIVRGTGNMQLPSATLLGVVVLQVAFGSGLGLGIGPLPRLGMVGIALGAVTAYSAGAAFLVWYLRRPDVRVNLKLRGIPLRWNIFYDILKVGSLSCIAPLQTNLTVLIVTGLVSTFGTEALAGYGIGARLEMLLVNIAFGIGVTCVPMVGTAMGSGNIRRARRVTWTGGALVAVILGGVGIVVSLRPGLWANIFTAEPATLQYAYLYLMWSGPAYAFFGLGLCLFFASQGSGKVLGPVLAGTLRLMIVACCGFWLNHCAAPIWTLFAMVAGGMVAYGLATAHAIYLVDWD